MLLTLYIWVQSRDQNSTNIISRKKLRAVRSWNKIAHFSTTRKYLADTFQSNTIKNFRNKSNLIVRYHVGSQFETGNKSKAIKFKIETVNSVIVACCLVKVNTYNLLWHWRGMCRFQRSEGSLGKMTKKNAWN